ncbi:MAG: hypothetical protein WAU89_23380 [Candidatus Acidiferrales bacterium]
MASESLRINVGQTEFSIVAGTTAPTGGDIMLAYDLTKLHGGNIEVLQALKMFENYIMGKSTKVG